MSETCPHCQQDLNLNDSQRAKLQGTLAKLQEGKVLKIKCPHCQQPIEFKDDRSIDEVGVDITTTSSPTSSKSRSKLSPPPTAPDLEWLHSGHFMEEEIIEDIPKALVLIPTVQIQKPVSHALREAGFQTMQASSDTDAIEKIRFENFSIVVLHCSKNDLSQSVFHTLMCEMAMNKRRTLIYVLVGLDYSTLYDLQALACSANLVINEKEINKFDIILKKTRHDYEILWRPLLGAIKQMGKESRK